MQSRTFVAISTELWKPNVISVVDGLRQGDDIEAFLAQKVCGFLCAVATEDDEAVELHLLVVILHVLDFIDAVFIDDAHELERLAGGAQNGTAER